MYVFLEFDNSITIDIMNRALSKKNQAATNGGQTVNIPPPATTTVDNNIYDKDVSPNREIDVEKQRSGNTGYGKIQMNRIGAPPAHLAASVASSDTESENSVSVGKQLQMEAENAIKYRTCSWQKVSK
jgi:hypothetical protein